MIGKCDVILQLSPSADEEQEFEHSPSPRRYITRSCEQELQPYQHVVLPHREEPLQQQQHQQKLATRQIPLISGQSAVWQCFQLHTAFTTWLFCERKKYPRKLLLYALSK